jgi:tryptophan-rich sensory protein
MNGTSSTLRNGLSLAGFIAVTFCAPLAGMFSLPGGWYAALNKPEWNPPSWIFGPVWTLLYLLMAVAAWRVWRRDGWRWPLRFYFVQLALNAAWTPVFFGAHRIGLALVVIAALWRRFFARCWPSGVSANPLGGCSCHTWRGFPLPLSSTTPCGG